MFDPLFCVVYTLISPQMTCGLKELLLNGQSQEAAVSLFPRLFSCITLRLGASVGVSTAKSNNKHAPSVHVAGLEYPICYSDEKFQSTNMFLVQVHPF